MRKGFRTVIALMLVGGVGAFHFVTPLTFSNQQLSAEESNSTTSESVLTFDLSYQSSSRREPLVQVKDYSHVEQGSFFLQQQGQSGFTLSPLLDTQVDITVTGLVARARVTQVFTNSSDQWVNGIYVFPLPENAAVDHLEMHIGDRKIVGEIHPKQRANDLYQQAKQSGKKASLLIQERPNLFKNSVANIAPQERIQVTIEYQQAIAFIGGEFSLRFPTTITPRYMPSTPMHAEHQGIESNGWGVTATRFHQSPMDKNDESKSRHKLAMNISLNSGFELAKISSEFHPIHSAQTAPGRYEVSLQEPMIANRDFVLKWQTKPNLTPTAAHFVQRTEAGDYGLLMLMPPSPQDLNLQAQDPRHTNRFRRDVIFVIDTSGSMAGASIVQAKQALKLAVAQLSEFDKFNLVAFESSAHKLWVSSQPATSNNKQQAIEFIDQLSAEGGTEMLPALQLALGQQNPESERVRQVIFVTDGAIANESSLFAHIDQHVQTSRLFTVGIGSAPNSYFMTEAARMGKGTFTYIGSTEAVEQQMLSLFQTICAPVVKDLALDHLVDMEVYPSNLPDLYQAEPLMLSYFSREPVDELWVSGEVKQHSWRQAVGLKNAGKQAGLDVLWARRKIAQLQRDKIKGGDKQALDQQIEQLALQHHLVSNMTSLVAVDRTPTALAKSTDVQLINQAPHGQLVGILPQTSTSSALRLLLGFILMSVGLCITFITICR